ncbi:MAG: hypothetical protein Q9213_003357 [Squamulea squamosa]
MQNAPYEPNAYQKGGAVGIPTGDHWINPELSTQPHAWHMHADAANAQICQSPQSLNPHLPLSVSTQAAVSQSPLALDHHYKNYHSKGNTVSSSLIESNNDTGLQGLYKYPVTKGSYRQPEEESQRDFPCGLYLHQHGQVYHNSTRETNIFRPGHATPTLYNGELHSIRRGFGDLSYGGPQSSQHVPSLMCRFPGCFAIFPERWMVYEHSKVHANTSESLAIGLPNCNVGSSAAPLVNPLSHDVAVNGLPAAPLIGNDPYGQGFQGYHQSSPRLTAPTATTSVGLMPTSYAYDENMLLDVGNATAGGSLESTTPLETSTSASTPTKTVDRLSCSFPGCKTTCARAGDLRRHRLKHGPGPKQFSCPTPGCSRVGVNGFDRKDKMQSHLKTCSGRAGRVGSQA